jgi:hypothetical protein
MIPDALDVLARQLHVQVKRCEHFNPNVGAWAYRELRARVRGYRVSALLSESHVEVEVKGLDTQVSFSINGPDRVCLLDRPLGTSLSCPVFVAVSATQTTIEWLHAPENTKLLADLDLAPHESLQVYRNAVVLIGELGRANEKTVLRLCDLADRVRNETREGLIDGLAFSVEKLPPALQSLAPLVHRFATGDDAIRDDLITETAAAEWALVCAQVEPLLPQINAFLDSFGARPLSNEATLIGRLAEAVVERGSREA